MPGKSPRALIIAATTLALAACATYATPATEDVMPAASTTLPVLMPVKEWPLRFRSHSFSAWCYDTMECSLWYAGLEYGGETPSPPSSKYGPGYLDHWSGTHLMIHNFPAPAEVRWRSKDGELHEARIDIGELFKDQLIRHNVARDEMSDVPDGRFTNQPGILMEINDRTIRVYMRAHISTKKLQKAGNRYSGFRNDLILVRTYNY